MRWDSDPNLIVVQSRLFSPGYAGPGRWVLFQPKGRRAFSAIGPDVVPDVIHILARACGGAEDREIEAAVPHVPVAHVNGLYKSGLLVQEPAAGRALSSFVSRFQIASYNYPFQDYFDPDWRASEERLLKHYDALWAPPPAVARRKGQIQTLPNADFAELNVQGSNGLTVAWLSSVLRYTFGPIGEIRTSRLICMRRTSPSGGARHPTEGVVLLPNGLGEIQAGAYIYDVERHGLIESPEHSHLVHPLRSRATFGIVVRSRVERAMWRYRELRAWRPVLLDAGHIIETLSLLLAARDYDSHVVGAAPASDRDFHWLEEPDLAVIMASPGQPEPWTWPRFQALDDGSDAAEYLTNPALYFSFRPRGLRSHVPWPCKGVQDIDFIDFRILSHCLPSNRGDRDTHPEGIVAAVDGATPDRIENLACSGALLPRTRAAALYDAARLWVRHSWYLTLLAHLESAARSEEPSPVSRVASRNFLRSLAPLLTRRTTRSFARIPVTARELQTLVDRVLDGAASNSSICARVACLDVAGKEEGIYEWNITAAEIGAKVGALSRVEARHMAVGQAAVEAAAALILLTRTVRTSNATEYEMDILDLGRMGQRVCLIAEELGLGVFLTPALADESTLASLKVPDPENVVAYLFAIGKRHGT